MDRDRLATWNRREWLQLVGTGAGLGVLGGLGGERLLMAAGQGAARAKMTFSRGAVVRTILKDIPPEALAGGATLFHEHLSINLSVLGGRNAPPPATPPPPPATDNVELMVQLVNKAGTEGVSCIVDGGHTDMGRKMADLKTIASRTKVHIVAAGGLYMGRTYPEDVGGKSDDQIAEDLVREAREQRHGAFGEIGENPNAAELTLDERKVFRAVGKASVRTGLPIFTHNSYGTGPNIPKDIGLQQLDILESVGVRPQHIAIGHTCCLDDPQATIIKEIARRGAFVGFDRVTTVQIVPDAKKLTMVLAFLDAGFADKLLLAADFIGQRTMNEGPGYGRTVTGFLPMMRQAGVKEETIQMIIQDNPRRFLAFTPASK
jgi:phosphotriesterase-related protein